MRLLFITGLITIIEKVKCIEYVYDVVMAWEGLEGVPVSFCLLANLDSLLSHI